MTQPQQHYEVTDGDFDFIWKNIDSPLVVRDRINVIKTRSHSHQSEQYCLWIEDEDGVYQTSCLHSFEFMDGTPERNGIKYCPYCGNLIRQKAGEP